MKLAGRILTTVILVLLAIQVLPVSQILSEAEVFAQYVDTAWVRTYNGPGDSVDVACDIAVDDSGNVYVTGYSYNDGTYDDYATIKYSPSGDTAWLRRYNGVGDSADQASAIAVDDSGNVYVTGESYGATNFDYATIKYYPNGDTAWVRRHDGYGAAQATSLTLDDSGNVYVTGACVGVESLWDYLTIKYYPNGDTAWVRRYNRILPWGLVDRADAIAVDDSGYVYVTGNSMGPGTDFDYATIKYHPNGDTAWVRTYNGTGNYEDFPHDLAVDNSGNVYVTGQAYSSGTYQDYVTIKYYADGDTAWVRSYNGTALDGDCARAIATDESGNVYVTGYSWGGLTYNDYATIKYDFSGNEVWVRRYNGPRNWYDAAYDIALDGSGNIYVTGDDSHSSGTYDDYATIMYYPNGDTGWVRKYNGPNDSIDVASAIAVDDSGNVYVTGKSYGGVATDYDYATIKYIQYDSIPFAPAVNYGAGNLPKSVFCADLDSDNDLDLAVANSGSGNNVSILKNNGDGAFQTKVDYGAGDGPTSVFCADLDGDSDLDLAVANDGSDDVSILKNNGNGAFQTKVDYGAGDRPLSVFCADLDGDADLDLAVANYDDHTVSILKNNGDGTFQPKVDYGVGQFPYSVFCADLDGDADMDLAVANSGSNNVSILKNNGNGTFQPKVDYGVTDNPGSTPVSVFCADLDGDSDLDLAVAIYYLHNISILKNNGDGTFQTYICYDAPQYPTSISCADIDGDTDLELCAANDHVNTVSIVMNNGNGTFQHAVRYGVGGDNPWSVFPADLDGDGDLDLAVANLFSHTVSILKNLTQIPANKPPWAFSLNSPVDGDTTFGTTTFQWYIPYDPNFGDQMRYDLYLSTSPGFEEPTIYSNLAVSKFITAMDSGTYYWKVKAKDNWGAETWSAETWSFAVRPLFDTLWIVAYSPVDLIVTDPVGDSISLDTNTIQDADYDTTVDWNEDGDSDDLVTIPHPYVGEYQIRVIREDDIAPDDTTYDLGIRINGSALDLLADDEPLPPPDGCSDYSYDCLPCLRGDVNCDGVINSADIVYLINYLFKSGAAPDPLELGDVNCDDVINSADVVYLIDYLFKGGPPPCS